MTRIRFLIVAMCVVACGNTDELDDKVSKLEAQIAALRQEHQFASQLQNQQQAKLDELLKKIDALEKRAPAAPSYARPTRRAPDAAKTYSVPVDASDPVDGPSDALVTIVEGYEYACPYCEKVRPAMAELKKRYGKDLRIVYKQLVVHPQTANTAALAVCAANKQHKFAKMDELLWEGFKARTFDKTDCLYNSSCTVVDGFAKRIGLDLKRFRTDMGECKLWLSSNQSRLSKLGANATPTFFINGRYLAGALPVDSFAALVDEELTKAKAAVQQGTPRGSYYQTQIVDKGETELPP